MKHFLDGPDRDLNLVFMTEGYCIFLALAVLFSAYLPSWSILGLELRNFLRLHSSACSGCKHSLVFESPSFKHARYTSYSTTGYRLPLHFRRMNLLVGNSTPCLPNATIRESHSGRRPMTNEAPPIYPRYPENFCSLEYILYPATPELRSERRYGVRSNSAPPFLGASTPRNRYSSSESIGDAKVRSVCATKGRSEKNLATNRPYWKQC